MKVNIMAMKKNKIQKRKKQLINKVKIKKKIE